MPMTIQQEAPEEFSIRRDVVDELERATQQYQVYWQLAEVGHFAALAGAEPEQVRTTCSSNTIHLIGEDPHACLG